MALITTGIADINLVPYKPSGWSDKIVVSKTTGNHTDSSSLTPSDTLYVDWAVENDGSNSTALTFYTQLFVDDVLKATFDTPPPLSGGSYASFSDWSIGQLSAGTHTIRIKTDSTNVITESRGSDNEYTKTITVASSTTPNLTPYKPSGWSDKIVVSRTTGNTTDSSSLTTADNLYVDWAVVNNGTGATSATFSTQLFVDDVLKLTATTPPPLNTSSDAVVFDHSIGALSAGTHTIRVKTDSTGAINETSENDNEYSKTITVAAVTSPNLTPYTPSGWSDKIVVSRTTGNTTDSTSLTTADSLYVDWAVINNGTGPTGAAFSTQLFVDNVLVLTANTPPPLNTSADAVVFDHSIGQLSAGTHTIRVKIDSASAINETSESDNEYTKTITIITATSPNLTPYTPSGWSDKIVVSRATGNTTDNTSLTTADNLYVDFAVINNGTAATSTAFSTQLFVDGVLTLTANTPPPLNISMDAVVFDNPIGTLSVGTHTIRLKTDSTGAISESNEGDNEYTKTITITGSNDADIRIEPTNLTIGTGATSAPLVNSSDAALSRQSNHAADSVQVPARADTMTVAGKALKRRRIPVKPPKTRLEKGFNRDAVAVTFKDGLTIRARGGNLDDLGTGHLASATTLLASLSKGRWERIDALPEARVEEMRQKAQRNLRREISDLNLQFRFYIPAGTDAAAVIDQLNALDIVELAQPIQQTSTSSPPSFESNQGYLNSAPAGISASTANSLYGARGAGIKLADVEFSFNRNHRDLPSSIIVIGGSLPPVQTNLNQHPNVEDVKHGTAVLGQLVGKDDGKGVRGIAPDCTVLFSSAGAGYTDEVAQAILVAANELAAGDVILLELQLDGGPRFGQIPSNPDFGKLPLEWNSIAYDRIMTAVGQGIIVVESAGNGSQNLDDDIYHNPSQNNGHHPFLPENDSGAILVGAGAAPGGSGPQRSRLTFSNFSNSGGTLDLQGWGERVWTTGYGSIYSEDPPNYDYTDSFSGTSSASPIVAGACVLLQSAYKARSGNVLSPLDVRQILRATGSPQQGNTAQNIGPMPNVSAAIASIIPGDSATSFRIHNDGTAPLTVSSLALNQATSWISFSAQTPFDVPPDSYRTVTVFADYSQAPTGQTVRQIAVRSNDPNEDPYPGGVAVTINTPPPVTYSLSLTANNGTITKNPDSVNYAAGSQVVLTATPANGYQFSGWNGDATGATNPLTVVMSSNKSVTASFTAIPSNNAGLDSLALSVGSLNPAFSSATTTFAASVSNSVTSVTTTASVAHSGATIKINGISVTSGSPSSPISLPVGNTTIQVVVTAQNGTTQKSYVVTVTRETYYATWAKANGVTGIRSGPSDNFDNDGMNNLLEMAFATNATAVDSGVINLNENLITRHGGPTLTLGNDLHLNVLFGRRKNYLAAGLTYTVKFSADLTNWENSIVVPTVIADDGEIEAVTVPFPSSFDKSGFYKVQILAQ